MRSSRAKWIRKQLQEGNAAIFMQVRNYVGGRTEQMTPNSIYRTAKRMWSRGEADKKLWLKEIKMDKSKLQQPSQNAQSPSPVPDVMGSDAH